MWGLFSPLSQFPGVCNDAFSGGGKKFAHLIVLRAGHRHQHHGAFHVVVGHVEHLRMIRKKCRTLSEISTQNKPTWLC